MKFIADAMLGRLARRLRLLGFDVLYDRTLDDNTVIRIALEQQRLILTRDTGLASRPLARSHLFIRSDLVERQLEEVLSVYAVAADRALSRCSICNTPLAVLSKEEARDLVPEHVRMEQSVFFQCGTCGRVYWPGSHVKRMKLDKKK